VSFPLQSHAINLWLSTCFKQNQSVCKNCIKIGLNFWLHINRLTCVGGMKSDMPVQDVDCFLANHSFYIRKYYVHCTLAQGFYLIPVSATGDGENLTFSETKSVWSNLTVRRLWFTKKPTKTQLKTKGCWILGSFWCHSYNLSQAEDLIIGG